MSVAQRSVQAGLAAEPVDEIRNLTGVSCPGTDTNPQ
jgi:hypothetical protein